MLKKYKKLVMKEVKNKNKLWIQIKIKTFN